MLDKNTQDFIIDTIDDEELADDYANHIFYCGWHIVGLCTKREECAKHRGES